MRITNLTSKSPVLFDRFCFYFYISIWFLGILCAFKRNWIKYPLAQSCVSAPLSVRRAFPGSDRTDLHEILYWNFYYYLSRPSPFGQIWIK
jgi:hypothetical protein